MIFVKHFFGAGNIADFLGAFLPRDRQQPIQVVTRNCGFGGHGRHGFQFFQFLYGFVVHILWHAGGFDLFLELVEFALLAAAQFLLNRLYLLVQVILFLRPFHLPLYSRLNGAVHIELLDLDIEYVANASQTLRGIENFQQLLLLLNRELQVGGDGVSQLGRIFHAHRGNHGFIIQRLAELDVLFEKSSNPLHAGFNLGLHFSSVACHPDGSLHVAFSIGDLKNLAAFDAFDEYFDVAVGKLQALNDVDNRAHLVNLVGLGLIDAGVVLSSQENLLVTRKCLFQGVNA